MNCLIIYPEELKSNKHAIIKGPRVLELLENHQLQENITIKAGILNNQLCQAYVKCIQPQIELELSDFKAAPKQTELSAIIGISRPPTISKILEFSATFGIKEIYFVPSSKTKPGYTSSKIWQDQNYVKSLIKGLEQGCRTQLPKITKLAKFDDLEFILQNNYQQYFLADTNGSRLRLSEQISLPVIYAIGPEAGFSFEEIQYFLDKGFSKISLGPDMLRQEQAMIFINAQLSLLQN